MAIDTDAIRATTDIVAVVSTYTALKKMGAEFCGPCPIHGGDGDNFYVSPAKRIWSCFSHGCHECEEGNDVIGFLRRVENLTFLEACERLGSKSDWRPVSPIAQKAKPAPERVTSKPPVDVPEPDFAIKALGQPELIFPIHDLDGAILGYECRYPGKEIRIWSWGARGKEAPRWAVGHFSAPRPLYGLPRLLERLDAPVSIFEGPKKAEAGKRLLPAYVCISWTGGANAWHKHDLEPLRGRKILLWPDADEPGWAACQKLAAVLADPAGLACSVRIVGTHGMPEGWDVADAETAGWDTLKLIEWAKPRATDYQPILPAVAEAPETPPIEAYEGEPPRQAEPIPITRKRKKPGLSIVEGNTVRQPQSDAEPLPQAMSEDALADAFAEQHSENWRYVKPWGAWFEWDGDGWRRDETGKVDSLAVQVTRQALYWDEAKSLTPKERRQVNKRSTAGAVRDLAGLDRRIAATMDQWDADSWMLGVPGGVIDLRCAKLLPAEQEQYITKRCAVAPDNGRPERWLEYLKRCHNGNDEVIAYLRRFAGYACTGETGEHALAFLYGTGRNGKGVFLETISRILGDYAKTAAINTFLEQKNPAHSTELARLHKARLVVTEEAGAGGRWNESRIKHMTGGGKITARFMRMDDFEFQPTFKLLVASNHKPSLRTVDEAIKARIHLVPFTVTIPAEERDPELLDKLRAEWPQILGWMLDGCAEWQERGLTPPQRIVDATTEYMQSEDILGDWIAECCLLEGECDGADAFQNYRKWCDAQGHSPWSRIGWSRAMSERDSIDSRRSNGRTIFLGLSIKPTY